MENGETTRNAAKREALEETGTSVEPKELFLVANSPHAHHVNMLYLAELQTMDFHATDESSEVKLFSRNEIPWNEIAFYTIKLALTWFYEDIDKGQFSLHEIDF
jgi:ADP-ribose pyrophosphatase YjhB (NUDIX family)